MSKRAPRMMPGVLSAGWSTSQSATGVRWSAIDPSLRGDLVYVWGEGCSKADGALLNCALGVGEWDPLAKCERPSFLAELVARGYDISTLRFSVQKKREVAHA